MRILDGQADKESLRWILNNLSLLRKDQDQYEKSFLVGLDKAVAQNAAYRLIGLYHWVKATDLLASYLLRGAPVDIEAALCFHFLSAIKASGINPENHLLLWLWFASYLKIESL